MREVPLEARKVALLKAIDSAKKRGVTAVKVELEANLSRFNGNACECERCSNTTDCQNCNEGYVRCSENDDCTGCGWCDDGQNICNECDGDYDGAAANDGSWSDYRILQHVMDYLNISMEIERGQHDYTYNPSASSWLQFMRVYNDHSVDTEITFTVRLDDTENALKVLEVVDAFNDVCRRIGNPMNTDGAGLHMAWLFHPDCNYNTHLNNIVGEMSKTKVTNFIRAMNHMLPALFFLAAPKGRKNWTRSIGYRTPQIGYGQATGSSKYHAIHIYHGAIEYRVFDTCYETPDQVIDNLIVMSRSLRYFRVRYNGPSNPRRYNFGNDTDRTLERLYATEDAIDLLYEHIGSLKPSYYSLKELREQRGFTVTRTSVRNFTAEANHKAELAWQEYIERWEKSLPLVEDEVRANAMRRFLQNASVSQMRELSSEQISEQVENEVQESLRDHRGRQHRKDNYCQNIVENLMSQRRPRFTVIAS
jgi:hypothetical protein